MAQIVALVTFGALALVVYVVEGFDSWDRLSRRGRARAREWRDVARELDEAEGFREVRAGGSIVWGEVLAYAAPRCGIAPNAVHDIPVRPEGARTLWVRHGNAYEHVDIEYAQRFPPGWGRPPWAVALVGVGVLVAAVAVFAAEVDTALSVIAVAVAVGGAVTFASRVPRPVREAGRAPGRRGRARVSTSPGSDRGRTSHRGPGTVGDRRGDRSADPGPSHLPRSLRDPSGRRRGDLLDHPATSATCASSLGTDQALPDRTYVRYPDNMGYRGKLREQEQARELRAQNLTLQDIADRLGVAKSSVSPGSETSPSPRPSAATALSATEPPPRQKMAQIAELNQAGPDRIGTMSDDAFFAAGVALYAGEGSKRDGVVMFANSDPAMIPFFCRWFRSSSTSTSRASCERVPPRRSRSRRRRAFLVRADGVPRSRFLKAYRGVADPSIRKNKHAYGCAYVRYATRLRFIGP